MIISAHIPKTAGGSFRNTLQQAFGSRLFMDYGDPYHFIVPETPNLQMRLHRGFNQIKGAIRRRQFFRKIKESDLCIHGHFKASKYSNQFTDVKLVVWLRDPVERVASHYFYWLRRPDFGHSLCRRLYDEHLTLMNFAALDPFRNFQTRYLDSIPLSDFWFVGVQERFDELNALFLREIGVAQAGAHNRHINPYKKSSESYPLSDALRRDIEALNPLDVTLYQDARERAGFNRAGI